MNQMVLVAIVSMTAAVAIGGLIYAVIEPYLGGNARHRKRLESIQSRGALGSDAAKKAAGKTNRKLVQDTLKDIDERNAKQKKGRLTLSQLISQSGSSISKSKFYMISVVVGAISAFVVYALQVPYAMLTVPAAFIIGALGLPRWFLLRKRKRRFKAFILEFPNSIDVIVRGVKAGLPLQECIKIIAKESKEPVAGEFRRVVENQSIGMSVTQALRALCDSVPLPETNFFAISVAIQQQTGGNLSEVLSNLSTVLRARRMMAEKIKAMAAEAKASAGIIGALPPGVVVMVSYTSPDYMTPLFETSTGNLLLVITVVLMVVGILVMRWMVNFDY